MAEKDKKPEIQFTGFADVREQRMLEEITLKIGSGKTPKGGDSSYVLEGIPLLRSQNVYDDLVDLNDVAYITTQTDEEMKNSRVFKNDVLLNITGASIGRSAVYRLSSHSNVNQHVCIIRPIEGYSSDFIQLNLTSLKGQQQINNNQAGSGREGLNFQQIGKMSFVFPSIEEQAKIGSFFYNLDTLITLHQRKYDKLVIVKKSMLEKMFPKDGANVPEIRFAGFTDAWERRELGNLCTIFTDGDWIEAKDQSDNGIRLLQTGNVGVNEFIDKADKSKWITEDTFNRLNCSEVYPGDILISRLPEPAGRACIVPSIGKRMITAVDCTIVRPSDECNRKYLVQYLSSASYFNSVNNFLAGGTRQRISRSNLANFIVPLPSKSEQDKIGAVLGRLDHLLTLHQRELEKLKNIKKSMLEKMFV